MKDNLLFLKEVGVWIRVSTDDQAQGDSPAHHLERAKAYAASKGWRIKETYDLAGVSGKSVIDHPECKRMIKDLKRKHISGLIFSKLARLSRNKRELEDFAVLFQECGADMISLQDNIDTSTPSGRMFFTFQAAQAQWEREEIADRVKASIIIRAKMGKSINGSAPYGYHWVDRKLVPHPEEAPIRRKAYELFLQYRRKGAVAKLLNSSGYRTRVKAVWRETQVFRMLSETSAKGIYYFNRTKKHGDWQSIQKPESEWGKIACEPIVSEELWTQVNQILEEQLKSWKKPGRVPTQVFGNLARCSCGNKMYVRTGCPKYVCRKCHNKIPIETLEHIFVEKMKEMFASPEQVEAHLQEANRNLAEKQELVALHETKIKKLREEMHITHRLLLDGQITPQGFGEFYKPAEEQLNQLTAELPRLQGELDFEKVNSLSADEVVSEANKLYTHWNDMTRDERRRIAESVIEKLVIGEGEIDITLSCLTSSEELSKSQQRLMALLGITQRQVKVVRKPDSGRRSPRKVFPTKQETFGDHLLVARYEHGLTRRQLAGKIGVASIRIHNLETDQVQPTQNERTALVQILGVSLLKG